MGGEGREAVGFLACITGHMAGVLPLEGEGLPLEGEGVCIGGVLGDLSRPQPIHVGYIGYGQ